VTEGNSISQGICIIQTKKFTTTKYLIYASDDEFTVVAVVHLEAPNDWRIVLAKVVTVLPYLN
jgi:hypothetical protein